MSLTTTKMLPKLGYLYNTKIKTMLMRSKIPYVYYTFKF